MREKCVVMIVDDTPINLSILAEILESKYDVVFASNVLDALAKSKANIPDLILLDIQMPDMNGYEVLKALKKMPALEKVPVIFLTTMSQQADEAVGLKLGAVDYITKPISPELVKLRVGTHIGIKLQREELLKQQHMLAKK